MLKRRPWALRPRVVLCFDGDCSETLSCAGVASKCPCHNDVKVIKVITGTILLLVQRLLPTVPCKHLIRRTAGTETGRTPV